MRQILYFPSYLSLVYTYQYWKMRVKPHTHGVEDNNMAIQQIAGILEKHLGLSAAKLKELERYSEKEL